MSEETTTNPSINSHMIWSSDRYYEMALIALVLGMKNTVEFVEESHFEGLQFLFSYIVLVIILGTPLVIVEVSLSQYSKKGSIRIWDLCPVFNGLGYTSFIYLSVFLVQILSITTLMMRYMLNQLFWGTGWHTCSNVWNTEFCYTLESNFSRRLDCHDSHGQLKCDETAWSSSYSQYYYIIVTNFGSEIILWKTAAHFTVVIIMTTFVVYKGVKFMEKFIMYSLLIAGINFTILLYYSLIQRGTGLALKYFLFFDWASLKKLRNWSIAFKLLVWTTTLGSGGLRVLGSQNKFRGHSYMNGIMMILVNITVTVLYTIMYLCLCGSLSYYSNTPVESILRDGEPLVYAKIPRMLESLKGSHSFWNAIFFSHLFLMVMSKAIILSFIMLKTIMEFFPKTENHPKKTLFIMFVSIYLCNLPAYTAIGSTSSVIVNLAIVGGPMISIITILQTTVIIYIYGLTTVVDDIHFMLGFRMPLHWQIVLVLAPIILLALCVIQIKVYTDYVGTVNSFSTELAQILMLSSYMPIIVTAGYAIWHLRKRIWKCKWAKVFAPSESWYLTDQILRKSREMFSSSNMTEEYLYRQSKRREIEANEAIYNID